MCLLTRTLGIRYPGLLIGNLLMLLRWSLCKLPKQTPRNILHPTVLRIVNSIIPLRRKMCHMQLGSIGCISNAADDEFDDEWVVEHRPLSINMNELVQVGNILHPTVLRIVNSIIPLRRKMCHMQLGKSK
jgi:hypothetical protein